VVIVCFGLRGKVPLMVAPSPLLISLEYYGGSRIRRSVCGMAEPGEQPRPRSSPGAFISNWTTYDASFATKLRMAASNTFIKLRKRQACCGNNGQPGC
jgi:hypothetical protein